MSPIDYTGEERRTTHACIFHGEHVLSLNTLKENYEKTDTELDKMRIIQEQKVSYTNFKWAFSILLTIIVCISSINYYSARSATSAAYITMEKILESNHQVELGLVTVNAEIKSINEKIESSTNEHKFFREAVLVMLRHVSTNPDKGDYKRQMDLLNKGLD